MDFKISKDSDGSQPQEPHEEKKNQSALLVLLLILVGGFAYLYFFTDLIRPQQTQKTAEAPAPQVVKMPIPALEDNPAGPEGNAPEKAEGSKVAATAPVTEAVPAAEPAKPIVADKTTAAPVAKAAKAPADKAAPAKAVKATPAPAKIKEEPKKAPAAKPAVKKTAAAVKKDLPGEGGIKKPVSASHVKHKTAIKTKKPTTAPRSILVGNYILEETLSADLGRVRKAGFKPTIKAAARKKTSMHRLFIAEYNNREAAQSYLEKLSSYTSDAFVIDQGGKFAVYAGSYLQSEAASYEKDRLKAAGLTVTVRNADIAIPSQNMLVGPFKSKKETAAALARLKNAGLRAKLLQK